MKKLFIIMPALLCILLLASCSAKEPEVWVTEPAAPSYSSLEEFLEAVKTADESDYAYSRAKFEKLDKLIVPSFMPEGYKLYFIQVDRDYIALWYLPEDCLSDIRVSEMRNLNFYFEYHREDSLKSILKEANAKKSDLIDGKFFYWKTDYERRIFWEDHGSLLSMSLPGNMFVEDGNVISTFNNEESLVASLDEICRTEKIIIE